MRAMIQLDSDKARLHSKGDQAARDIVQFVRECLTQQKLSHSSKQFELKKYFIPSNICRSEHVPPLWKSRPRRLPARARSSKSSVESRQGRPSGDSQTGGQLFGAVFFFIEIFSTLFLPKNYWTLTRWQCWSLSSYVYTALPCDCFVCSEFHSNHVTGQKDICFTAWAVDKTFWLSPTFSGGWVHEERRHLTQSARHPGYSRRHSGRRFRQEIQHVDWTIWPQSEVFFQDFKPHIIVFLFWCVKVILNVVTRIVVVPLKHSNQTSYSCLQLKIR